MGGGVSSGDRVECESGEEGKESVMVGEGECEGGGGEGGVRVGGGERECEDREEGSVRVGRREGGVQWWGGGVEGKGECEDGEEGRGECEGGEDGRESTRVGRREGGVGTKHASDNRTLLTEKDRKNDSWRDLTPQPDQWPAMLKLTELLSDLATC